MKLLGGLVMLSGSQALDRNFNPDRPRVAGKTNFRRLMYSERIKNEFKSNFYQNRVQQRSTPIFNIALKNFL